MPPVMGVAAFVMAELLGVSYQSDRASRRHSCAGAYYVALYIGADLYARKTGLGTLTREDINRYAVDPAAPASPAAAAGADRDAVSRIVGANVGDLRDVVVLSDGVHSPRKLSRASTRLLTMFRDLGRQMAEIAIPIAAIGIIIAIAIQSNIALKFASGVISAGGGTILGSLLLVVIGCIIMGMGLPTVAAYIIGAILYVPALRELGVPILAAHFFVMYYCVLSMVTPPVALASYAAAGLAGASPMKTGLIAFRMSFVCFLVPFAFVIDPALLFQGTVLASHHRLRGPAHLHRVWAVGLIGYSDTASRLGRSHPADGVRRRGYCRANCLVAVARGDRHSSHLSVAQLALSELLASARLPARQAAPSAVGERAMSKGATFSREGRSRATRESGRASGRSPAIPASIIIRSSSCRPTTARCGG